MLALITHSWPIIEEASFFPASYHDDHSRHMHVSKLHSMQSCWKLEKYIAESGFKSSLATVSRPLYYSAPLALPAPRHTPESENIQSIYPRGLEGARLPKAHVDLNVYNRLVGPHLHYHAPDGPAIFRKLVFGMMHGGINGI